ncbi:HAD family hydrolase [Stenotrophomonas sp. 24(2023)]|uniref:HAD family hydrolase n=1 Tax=Stenotrophomonas sp. 24(2023) TaxID=3068324 RepID=UPI0027E206FB|nr:HAD family hydrolase [Stenotrophomonas sp. 24(2023)]WMJ68222.1 HAD family hydrolase [Stenotrophomonas sp. 24(2023)]
MAGSPPVVVFDFDLTLTRWDTASRFFRWRLRRDAWRLLLVAMAVPVLLPLLVLRGTRRWVIRYAVWVATLGLQPGDLPAQVQAFLQALPADVRDTVFLPDALAQLRLHMAGGHRVVVATGSLQPLARALLDGQGLADVPLVGSTLRRGLGGLVRDQHCVGANKIPMLAAVGFTPPWAVAYTDHHADLPVLQHSAACYVVNPQPRCLARIQQQLDTAVTVLHWA